LVGITLYSRSKCLWFIVASKGLLDDDDDDAAGAGASSTTINDRSAEIGNLQNQLQSTTRSLETTKTERSNIEVTVHNQAAQLSALQTQLSSAKAGYEAETGHLATLHGRHSKQSSEIQKVKEELIRAESDLSAMRLERAEVEQSLLHDKEEIRELQRKMTETGSSIEVTRVEIEKAKKDAKQQKGLLAIAKKQLAAREAERAKATQELQEALAEADEATKEREIAETELSRELVVNKANGLPFSPSPSLSGDSAIFAAAQPLPVTPGSPSSLGGSAAAKSSNPFERLAAGSGSRSQSPFLPFAEASVPTPPPVTSAQNEATTTDNPFTFDQAFGGEEARPGPDVEELLTGPERNVQPFAAKPIDEPRAAASEEVEEPSSDDLFTTPPTSALETLGTSVNALIAEPDVLKLPPVDSPAAATSTDPPLATPTDINAQITDRDVNESDSSDDETPLATLAGRSAPASNNGETAKEAPVTNGLRTTVEATFPPVTKTTATVEAQSTNTNPFPPAPSKDGSAFSGTTSPFTVSSEPTTTSAFSDFDKTFGDFASTSSPVAGNNLSFDAAFDDQFDFSKANPSTSLAAGGISTIASTAFPPAPTGGGASASAGAILRLRPATSPHQGPGFDNAFTPPQGIANPARPVSVADGLPVLPPVPESKPFSFEQAFGSNMSPLVPPAATATNTAPSQPPSSADAANTSFDDAFGLDTSQTTTTSAFGTISSRTSSIPQVTQSPVSAFTSSSSIRATTSPRDIVSFPALPHEGATPSSPPPRVASPPHKGRPSTSSKESVKEQGRHSKLSVSDIDQRRGSGVERLMTFVPVLDPSAIR